MHVEKCGLGAWLYERSSQYFGVLRKLFKNLGFRSGSPELWRLGLKSQS